MTCLKVILHVCCNGFVVTRLLWMRCQPPNLYGDGRGITRTRLVELLIHVSSASTMDLAVCWCSFYIVDQ